MGNLAKGLIVILLFAVVILLILQFAVVTQAVNSNNMEPGIAKGDSLLINKLAYWFSAPDRGEIVYCKSQTEYIEPVQRIIGLPGDIIEVKNNAIYVNGVRLKEPYVKFAPAFTLSPYEVPAGSYFVMGDNRNIGFGSPAADTVSRENIVGRAWIFIWPPHEWGAVDNYSTGQQFVSADSP